MFLSFWICTIHTYRISNKLLSKLFGKRKFHIPGFTIISFYYLYNLISKRDIKKIKQRFVRLLIPFFIIPVLIWLFNNLIFEILQFNQFKRKLKIKELIMQLIIGHKYYHIFWYQFITIFITLLFFIISFIFKNNFLIIFQIIGIIAYFLQYSEYNLKFLKYGLYIGYALGNIIEIIPFSVIGLSFGAIKLIHILEKYRVRTILISFLFLIFIFKYDLFMTIKGFYYPGIIHNFGGILLFINFSLIPFHNIKNKILVLFIKIITSNTGGIYYFHPLVRDILKFYFKSFKIKGIFRTIFIYICCYLISFIGLKIFGKTKLKYLFN